MLKNFDNCTWKHLYLPFFIFSLSGCGSLLDISGKGAKTECFYLEIDSLKVVFNCSEKRIFSTIIYQNEDAKQLFGKLLYKNSWEQPVKEFVLPISRDSIANKFIQIELHITETHFRETYYIEIKPKDLTMKKKIYARYFSH